MLFLYTVSDLEMRNHQFYITDNQKYPVYQRSCVKERLKRMAQRKKEIIRK